ncbi:peptidoglycan-binding protein [Hoeflea prorocentri]|uniref:Peptidoglycan-binding protein n=1 Tax=Hoeflea prorocentri TaxID=1922333 RepID=A0A9X3ZI37_9HYPH|nr:peptidoglycan-binding protein [Hoeflea prorocentri]MCY6382512.1 peptidoglycan-binding protein [Hoeflea prorocentri]MDA5400312.1 peptidoglycan-binding protein [Hoeflea prorocentri]
MNRSRPPKNWHDARQNSSVDVLNQSIADLEARIEALNHRNRHHNRRQETPQQAPERDSWQQRQTERQQLQSERLRQPVRQPMPQREPSGHYDSGRQQAATNAASRETGNAMREIADALVSLRNDMRRDVDEIKTITGSSAMPGEVREDLARLADQIAAFENARPDQNAQVLHHELDELRTMINEMAREDSMRRLENRWEGFEERISDLDPAAVREELITLSYRLDDIKSSIGQLPSALPLHALEDKIKMLVNAIDVMARQPAAADPEVARQFALLDERLDEISRAIVATQSAQANSVDQEIVERLESRMDALVERIGEIGQSNQTQIGRTSQAHNEMSERMEALTRRVEELAHEEAISAVAERLDNLTHTLVQQFSNTDPHLIAQLDELSRKVDAIDVEGVNAQLASHLSDLTLRIDNINSDLTATNGNQDMLYSRMEELANRVEHSVGREPVVDFTPIEMRLADLAARLDESQSPNYVSDDAIRNLEDQVSGLSQILNNPDTDGETAAVLEPRLAAIEDHLSVSRAKDEDMVIEAARQAAETAVANFQHRGAPAADMAAIESLVSDLRSLEDLSRRSEERSSRTIDAVHDTLLKIASRLERLEESAQHHVSPASGPVNFAMDDRFGDQERTPAPPLQTASAVYPPVDRDPVRDDIHTPSERDEPALENADDLLPGEPESRRSRSLLSGLKDRMKLGSSANTAADRLNHELQQIDPAPSIDPVGDLPQENFQPGEDDRDGDAVEPVIEMEPEGGIDPETANTPLEPGSGAPDIKRIMAKVREAQTLAGQEGTYSAESEHGKSDKADFIAAARRAARAAASEAADLEGEADLAGTKRKSGKRSGSLVRKPLLIAAGAVLLAVISYPLLSGFIGGGGERNVQNAAVEKPAVVEPVTEPVTEPVVAVAPDLPKVEVINKESVEEIDPNPVPALGNDALMSTAQTMSADNEVQPTSSFQSSAPAPSLEQVASVDSDTTQIAAVDPAPSLEPIALPSESVGPLALREAAADGDSLALFEIGARYTEGRGVPTDLGEAARWYKLSADRGFAPAQYRLANFYEKGTGVERDLDIATDWYNKAAEQGNASAMHNLAVLSAIGHNGEPDYAAAGQWFTKAADLGVKDSQFNLAILHARGTGVSQDLEETYKWFAIAAKSGDKDAANKRDEVAKALRPEQLESARAKVELWKAAPLVEAANVVVIPPEWRGSETRTASVDMTKAVKNIQAILTKNGFDTGGVDGIMGDRTVSAIKAFQESVGLEPTGEVNDALVKELIARNN